MRPRITRVEGISDVRRLPRLGKIRLGIKKVSKGGKEYPAEVDYFVCPPEVEAIYGKTPKELDVRLPVDDLSVIFPQAYESWGSNHVLKCQGDGLIAYERRDDNSWVERKCPCEALDKKRCTFRARLMVMLDKVSVAGVYQIDTGSKTSAFDVQSGIDFVRGIIGRAAMVPCVLRREPTIIAYEGKAQTHYTLQFRLALDEMRAIELFRNEPLRISYSVAEPEISDPTDDPNGVVIPADVTDEETTTAPGTSQDAPGSTNGTAGGETITDDQVLQLEALIEENGLTMKAVLGSLVVADLKDIPADQFEAAKDRVMGIIKGRKKNGGATDGLPY